MKRRWTIRLVFIVAILSPLIFLLVLRMGEPVYDGTRVSEWIEISWKTADEGERERARTAIREIGVEAVPYVFGSLRSESSSSRELYLRCYASDLMPDWLRSHLPRPSRERFKPGHAADVLSEMDASIVPSLVEGLNSKNMSIRAASAMAFSENFGSDYDVTEVLPALLNAANDPDREVWVGAIFALEHVIPMAEDKSAVVPVLRSVFRRQGLGLWPVWNKAVQLLGVIGEDATEALPEIKKMMVVSFGQNPEVQVVAAIAFWKIERNPQNRVILDAFLSSWATTIYLKEVCEVLVEMGPAAAEMFPLLLDSYSKAVEYSKLIRRPNEGIEFLREALYAIDPIAAAEAGVTPLPEAIEE